MEGDEAEPSTPQSPVVSSVKMVDNKKKVKGPGEASRTRYLERVKNLDLEDLACRQELTKVLGIKSLSHEDLSNHYRVGWLRPMRRTSLEPRHWTGIPQRSIMGPINYRFSRSWDVQASLWSLPSIRPV